MADILPNSIPDLYELRARWGGFAFTAEKEAQGRAIGVIYIMFGEVDRCVRQT